MKKLSIRKKILKITLILEIILIIFKLVINALILILEFMEFKVKIRITRYFYERGMRRNLERYGIRGDVAIKISKEISQREYAIIKDLTTMRNFMKIFRGS
ncbi:MAG: hypothetical protein QXI93_02470 [Candidatus Methanomethylicia archaeon]